MVSIRRAHRSEQETRLQPYFPLRSLGGEGLLARGGSWAWDLTWAEALVVPALRR